jgi:peptidylprolyl isomerase
MIRTLTIAASAALLMGAGPDRRDLDPENTLVIETTKGRIVVEMAPLLAPKSVERVKLLARERVYDGLQMHRVVPGFVVQTGNPNNKDGGVSAHPDLPPEFHFRVPADAVKIAVERSDGFEGFVGSTPVAGVSAKERARAANGLVRGWGAYCAGVVGMGRQADPNTANSEIFFMLDPARRLDHEYAVWGRVVSGMDVVRALAPGEPPASPDLMIKVRVAADLPQVERPKIRVLNEHGGEFARRLAELTRSKGSRFSVCDIEPHPP